MTNWMTPWLLSLAMAATAVSQEAGDDLLYRAFYAEVAQRDFVQAESLYAQAAAASAKSKQVDRQAKSLVGRGRCLALLGKKDEARGCFDQALALAPNLADARNELARLLAPSETSKRIVDRIDQLLEELAGDTSDSALLDFARMGDVAVPTLASRLRDEDVTVVVRAAKALANIQSGASYDAIAAALADPQMLYPGAVVEALENRTVRDVTLPAFLAALSRKELVVRERMAGILAEHGLGEEPGAAASTALIRKLAQDPAPSVRAVAFQLAVQHETMSALLPMLTEMLASPDREERQLAAICISNNSYLLSPEELDATLGRVEQDPDPAIRGQALVNEVHRATSRDPRRAASVVARMLSDESAVVFGEGVECLRTQEVRRAIDESFHEVVAQAWRRALEEPALKDETRHDVLSRLDPVLMTDEELFDLFVRAGGPQCVAKEADVRSARKDLTRTIHSRVDSRERAAVAARLMARIADVPGRLQWFERFDDESAYFGELERTAANDDSLEVRRAAYQSVARMRSRSSSSPGVDSTQLGHLKEDLERGDETLTRMLLSILAPVPNPAIVPALRAIAQKSTGAFHSAAVAALAGAAGRDALPELRAELRATPKGGDFPFLAQLEQAVGLELAADLVAIAKERGSASTVVGWMTWGTTEPPRVTPALIEAFVRQAPSELFSWWDLQRVAGSLPVGLLSERIVAALKSPDAELRRTAAALAGQWSVELATPELVKLLDSGDGPMRDVAMESLKKLQEYRAIRGRDPDRDAEARRAAFDKAKSMLASPDAEQRMGAALALGALGEVASVPLLLDLMKDGNVDVRAAARKALEKLNTVPAAAPGGTQRPAGDAKGGSGKPNG